MRRMVVTMQIGAVDRIVPLGHAVNGYDLIETMLRAIVGY